MKLLNKSNNYLIALYLFIMLGVFPLYYRYQYSKMGDSKYKFFLYTTSVFVVLFLLLYICRKVCAYRIKKAGYNRKKRKELIKEGIQVRTILDIAVFTYFISTTVSALFSPVREAAFWGAAGWKMGFCSQFLFVAVYFILTREWEFQKWAIVLLEVSSAMVFIIAIFHRFDVDILPIYGDLKASYKAEFLSTMGQASWYSSFLCTVFPVGLYSFFVEKQKNKRILLGVYSALAMMSLVTQNTDSAFLALAAVLMGLFYLSFDNRQKEFLETIILILGSFCFIGIMQRIFRDRMIPLDTLSLFMSQSIWIWILLVAVLACYLWLYRETIFIKKNENNKGKRSKEPQVEKMIGSRKWFWGLFGVIGIAFVSVIIFIVLNTNGFLLEKFGYQSTNNYLYFNKGWGNQRGFSWMFTVNTYADFPFIRKMIGIGPDCFSAYIKSVPEYFDQIKEFFGNLVLTNAHNEYLTKLFNLGVIGLLSYLFMLITAVVTFIKKRSENLLLPAFALCVVSYMAHNVFCYEQVCCTPFFYILLGIGSNLLHNKDKKGAY